MYELNELLQVPVIKAGFLLGVAYYAAKGAYIVCCIIGEKCYHRFIRG